MTYYNEILARWQVWVPSDNGKYWAKNVAKGGQINDTAK